MMGTLAKAGVACCAIAVVSSCASRNDVRAGHDAREALMTQIQRTETQLTVAKSSLEKAMSSLDAVLQPQVPDVVSRFEEFAQHLDLGKEQLEEFDAQVVRMDRLAEKFFDGWRSDFEEFHGEQMRKLSEQRLSTIQQKYQRIGATIQPIRERCDQLVLMLEDKRLFLEHDLTPASTAFLRAEGGMFKVGSDALFGEFADIGSVSSRFVAAVDTGDRAPAAPEAGAGASAR